jgi:hypothetical protein
MKITLCLFTLLIVSSLNISCALSDSKSIAVERNNQVSMKSEEHFREHAVSMPSLLKIYSPEKKSSKQISGICFITASAKSFFDMPCTGVYISLLDQKNRIVTKVKADERGRFRFLGVDPSKTYHLGVASEGYKTLSEKVYVSTGVDLLLELVEK